MTMAHYEKAQLMILGQPESAFFSGGKPPALVSRAEKALGVEFPPTYRRFLLEFGAGSFRSAEFFGVVDEDWDESSVPDAIWYTLDERRLAGLPHNLIVVGEVGTGELYVIDVTKPEGPVFVVGLERKGQLEPVAADFGDFFLDRVQRAGL